MDKKYIDLFKELARVTTTSAEQVMDYDHDKDDKHGYEAAKTLRDDFMKLYDTINDKEFDGTLAKEDFARLLVGALIVTNQIHDRLNSMKKALAGYETDLIPKLKDIVDNASSNEEAMKIANEKFVINSEE